jgi:hypothetical protein
MSTLESWITEASTALNLPPKSFDDTLRDELLDLTRDVAHGVARVAGPLTTYLIGVAVGAGMPRDAAIQTIRDRAAVHAADEPAAE